MTRQKYLYPLIALAFTTPASAAMISGSMAFDIFASDPDTAVAQGFVDLDRNRITDFELTFNGHTWDLADVDPCRCEAWSPTALNLVVLTGGDAFGDFLLFFDLHPEHDAFQMSLAGISGNLRDGTAGARLTEFSLFRDVPEPGTLPLFALALIGLVYVRRRCALS